MVKTINDSLLGFIYSLAINISSILFRAVSSLFSLLEANEVPLLLPLFGIFVESS